MVVFYHPQVSNSLRSTAISYTRTLSRRFLGMMFGWDSPCVLTLFLAVQLILVIQGSYMMLSCLSVVYCHYFIAAHSCLSLHCATSNTGVSWYTVSCGRALGTALFRSPSLLPRDRPLARRSAQRMAGLAGACLSRARTHRLLVVLHHGFVCWKLAFFTESRHGPMQRTCTCALNWTVCVVRATRTLSISPRVTFPASVTLERRVNDPIQHR